MFPVVGLIADIDIVWCMPSIALTSEGEVDESDGSRSSTTSLVDDERDAPVYSYALQRMLELPASMASMMDFMMLCYYGMDWMSSGSMQTKHKAPVE